jgi:hypothetical protein
MVSCIQTQCLLHISTVHSIHTYKKKVLEITLLQYFIEMLYLIKTTALKITQYIYIQTTYFKYSKFKLSSLTQKVLFITLNICILNYIIFMIITQCKARKALQ